jgi:integrase
MKVVQRLRQRGTIFANHDNASPSICGPFSRPTWARPLLFSSRQRSAHPASWLARVRCLHGCISGSPRGIESQPKPTNYATKGTFNHLALEYFSSPDFLRLRQQTRHVYRLVIERFLEDHGHRLVREMIRDDVKRIVASKADTPGAANDLLKKIRALIRFAIESGIRADDPTLRIKAFPEGEIHTWTEDEIAQFEERWPKGTKQRTAFALFLYTGQRRSDVVRMAWTDLKGDAIKVIQQKTGARLTIRLHPELGEILRRWPRTPSSESLLVSLVLAT